MKKAIYVISDLHIGGSEHRYIKDVDRIEKLAEFINEIASRTDGIAKELVINGDFIDFLAEKDESGNWHSFLEDPNTVISILDKIYKENKIVFDALTNLVDKENKLTLLLGNHDIELSFPMVRKKLQELLKVRDGQRFHFIYDNEAYVISDKILIEHGNRYDSWNMIDHDKLRQIRSLQSRKNSIEQFKFSPPPGSELVAEVMNPIKEKFSFVDLLKPENETVLPVCLTLESNCKNKIWSLLSTFKFKLKTNLHGLSSPSTPSNEWEINLKEELLTKGLEQNYIEVLLQSDLDKKKENLSTEEDIGYFSALLSNAKLALSSDSLAENRIPILMEALNALPINLDNCRDSGFPGDVFLKAAEEIAANGYEAVIFGHTHIPKNIKINEGARYLNSGSWYFTIPFPKIEEELTEEEKRKPFPEIKEKLTEEQKRKKLEDFIKSLRDNNFDQFKKFEPTYVYIELDENESVSKLELKDYHYKK